VAACAAANTLGTLEMTINHLVAACTAWDLGHQLMIVPTHLVAAYTAGNGDVFTIAGVYNRVAA
jgi:hypothetical protein